LAGPGRRAARRRQPLGNAEALDLAGGWLGRRVRAGHVLAFVVAGLSLGADSAALSFRLLGAQLGAARLAGGVVLALCAALAVRSAKPLAAADPLQPLAAHAPGPALPRLLGALRALLDQYGTALCFGLLACAALEAALAPQLLAGLGSPWDLLLAAAAAALCQLSGKAATPLAAVLVHKGASVGAALSFLWLSPLLRSALLACLRRRLGLRAEPGFAASAISVAMELGLAASQALSARAVPEIHPRAHAPWELACALALGCLLLASLLRLGPRGFAAELRAAPRAHAEHAHGRDTGAVVLGARAAHHRR